MPDSRVAIHGYCRMKRTTDWPSAEKKMFMEHGGDSQGVACLSMFENDRNSSAIRGYRRAAEVLYEHAIKGKDQDLLAYPIVYLGRHHIELLLKEILSNSKVALGEDGEVKRTHKLGVLWNEARALLQRFEKEGNICLPAEVKHVDSIIEELACFDCSGEIFRYALPKEKSKADYELVMRLKTLDIGNFIERLCELSNFLECFLTVTALTEYE